MRTGTLSTALSRAILPALALFAPALACPALAESPAIAEQHAKYLAAARHWEEKHLPQGLGQAASFAAKEKAPEPRSSGTARTAMLLSNVDFEYTSGIGFSVKKLIVTLESKKAGGAVDMDKVDSFIIRVHQGEITLPPASLSALFNKYLLATKSPSLANMRMKTLDGRLAADADLLLLGGIGVPVSFAGPVSLSNDNRLAFQVQAISSFGIPLGGPMKALGMSLPAVVSIKKPGVAIGGFTIGMDHRKVFPLPELTGNIAALHVHADGLHLSFNDAPEAELAPPSFLKDSYIWLQSGDPVFYGAVVTNAQIAMVPQSEGRRLHFSLYNYRSQLATGEATLSEDGMMVVRLP
jgi:hypothetical protein